MGETGTVVVASINLRHTTEYVAGKKITSELFTSYYLFTSDHKMVCNKCGAIGTKPVTHTAGCANHLPFIHNTAEVTTTLASAFAQAIGMSHKLLDKLLQPA